MGNGGQRFGGVRVRPRTLAEQRQWLRLRRRRRGPAARHRRARPAQRRAADVESRTQSAWCRGLCAVPQQRRPLRRQRHELHRQSQVPAPADRELPAPGWRGACPDHHRVPARQHVPGGSAGTNISNILYRVDAGGPTIPATDNGPDWMADGSDRDRCAVPQHRQQLRGVQLLRDSEPLGPVEHAGSHLRHRTLGSGQPNDGSEMHWSFPVPAAPTSRSGCTSPTGTAAPANRANACSTWQSTDRGALELRHRGRRR